MSTPANPLHNNPAASAELTARYCKLYRDYKLAVNAVHINDKAISGAPLWEWRGPPGLELFAASSRPPLITFLATPRLPPELAQHLNHQPQQQQQQ